MTNQDYIRKAVELADGFAYHENYECPAYVTSPPPCNLDYEIVDIPQLFLDALAAQLVRQVDASGKAWFQSSREGISSLHIDPHRHEKYDDRLAESDGPDRTMNTLRAIVESKVLEQ